MLPVTSKTKLIRIIAPHFVAGLELDENNYAVKAAPILYWMVSQHKSYDFIDYWCGRKGYTIELLD